jgi:hypothetical protein
LCVFCLKPIWGDGNEEVWQILQQRHRLPAIFAENQILSLLYLEKTNEKMQ